VDDKEEAVEADADQLGVVVERGKTSASAVVEETKATRVN
jgi:hypothetical protein